MSARARHAMLALAAAALSHGAVLAQAAPPASAAASAPAASAAASAPAAPADAAADAPRRPSTDPFEGWNRGVFAFNEALDKAVLKPVATAYTEIVPSPLRTGVRNFFGNFGDVWSSLNHLLQGKPGTAVQMTMRVATNTVFGIGGLLDVATEAGLERHEEDFGQTLGVWGFGPGPYLMWPLLGPSTLRDSFALPLDRGWSPSLVAGDDPTQWGLFSLQLVDTRANLLGASRVLEDVALDKYSFLRDAFLARRRSLIYDGDPPEEPEEPEAPQAREEPAPREQPKTPAPTPPAAPR